MDFGGTELCTLDVNGRLKISPKAIACFEKCGSRAVVLHCWPEGCLGILPKSTWERMYQEQGYSGSEMLSSIGGRQKQRLFNRFTQYDEITGQGRITIPAALRERANLEPGKDVVVSGYGEGLEIWHPERFAAINEELDQQENKELNDARHSGRG